MILWNEQSNDDSIAVSTRIRLARNLKDEFFPVLLPKEGQERIFNKVENALKEIQSFEVVRIKGLNVIDKNALLEKHIASKELIENPNGGLFISQNGTTVVMVNEEDHVRLHSIMGGYNIAKAYKQIKELDQKLMGIYAKNDKFGFLTACPTNVGTGMRASVMLHLPCINMTSQLKNIANVMSKMGMTIRGVYGEGSDSVGNMVQISNQVTLGRSEEEILENLTGVTQKIMENEMSARDLIFTNKKDMILDQIYRSLGVLKYAHLVSGKEMMNRLSDVKLGLAMGILNGIEHKDIHCLMMENQPCMIQQKEQKALTRINRDKIRAQNVKELISKVN